MNPITLPNDIRKAFERIAGYLRTVRKDRPHYEGTPAEHAELVGHVQTPEWIDGLLELAAEAERLANIADAGTGLGVEWRVEKYNVLADDEDNTWGIKAGDKWLVIDLRKKECENICTAHKAGAGIPGAPDIGPDPLKIAQHEERVEYGGKYLARLTQAGNVQQPGVPDQTALVWRIDLSRLTSELIQTRARLQLQNAKLNAPELLSFRDGVVLEAAHQRERWGSEHDAGKGPQDWFWLIGYLAGKALRAHIDGDTEKALHHTISSAAALANWHAAILGASNQMRPGISAEAQAKA